MNKKILWIVGLILGAVFMIPSLFFVIDSMISSLMMGTIDYLGSLIGYGFGFILGVSIFRYSYEKLKKPVLAENQQKHV